MSWNETPVTIATAVKAGRVTFSANKTRAGGGVLGLPGAIVGQLGWKEGQTFKLLVGSADHDGWIRIVPNPQGEIVFHTFGRGPAAKGAPRGGASPDRDIPAAHPRHDREVGLRASHHRQVARRAAAGGRALQGAGC